MIAVGHVRAFRVARRLLSLGSVAVAGLAAMAMAASAQTLAWQSQTPVYAVQAVNDVAANPGTLKIPGGLTFTSAFFAGGGGGTAVVVFTLPVGDVLDCGNPAPTATVSANFTNPIVSCNQGSTSPSIPGTVTVQVSAGFSTNSPGTVTLGSFGIAGISSGLSSLANFSPGNGQGLNCQAGTSDCVITAQVAVSSIGGLAAGLTAPSTIMADSGNELSVASSAPTNGAVGPVCIDLFSYQSNGLVFQQPCLATEGSTVALADLGSITITENYYLAADGVSPFIWSAGSSATGTVVLTGTCGGTALQATGSTPGNCGILTLTGQAAYLIPAGTVAPLTACPTTLSAAQTTQGAIAGSVSPPSATFVNVSFPNANSSNRVNFKSNLFYEVCAYALGTAVMGDSGGWSVAASIGSGPEATPANEATPPGDRLLTESYNGLISYFNFTNGGYNYTAYLHIANKTQNTSAEVVCEVVGDDGNNGYYSLWSGGGLAPGLTSFYAVPAIFAGAGVIASDSNPFDLGNLTCFHPQGVRINQIWIEPNGSLVDMP